MATENKKKQKRAAFTTPLEIEILLRQHSECDIFEKSNTDAAAKDGTEV